MLAAFLILPFVVAAFISCGTDKNGRKLNAAHGEDSLSIGEEGQPDGRRTVYALLLLPGKPLPGEPFRILACGGKDLGKARISISGPDGKSESRKAREGNEYPYWRVDDFPGAPEGKYTASIKLKGNEVFSLEFEIGPFREEIQGNGVWRSVRGWDPSTEIIYSAWINALFQGCNEKSSWSSLHDVTRDSTRNFLWNHLSLGEDDPLSKHSAIMQPDCADNPFFLRAYFAWKLGLPFGYHVCNRGSLNQAPRTGQYISNEAPTSRGNPVEAFNIFLRKLKDGVHSGTARTALEDESSDYYPLALTRQDLIPGTVYADPYGHTLTLTSMVAQSDDAPGLLLSVDAQPDGTIAIKRFWKGNFLFNTKGVVGEPGFKAFRPLAKEGERHSPLANGNLTDESGFRPFSLQQKRMEADTFYYLMERVINPKPLDAETAILDLINALHEQLQTRVGSVANAEEWFRKNPGTIIPMPSNASGIFLALGQWENFSTPNRDLRLLIAIDAVKNFPEAASAQGGLYKMRGTATAEEKRKELESILGRKASQLTITYKRSDGSPWTLTLEQILERSASFEMAYNPNDGPELRWGAPENSPEISTCRRRAPATQAEKMKAARHWFSKRLHPPT